MSAPLNSQSAYVPNDLIIPESFSEANLILTDYIKQIVDSLNEKAIGNYFNVETLSGQQWFDPGDASTTKFVTRKVINFGALPNTATTSVAHGISTTENTIFTHIYATATDPGASTVTGAIPIPYVDPNTLANGIEINVDATNVNITTAGDYSAYTICYVVLEYIQN